MGLQMGNESSLEMSRVAGRVQFERCTNIQGRNREEMHELMIKDFFSDNPIYGPSLFQDKYHMHYSFF